MLDMAVRHDATAVNPVRSAARLHRAKQETRALHIEDLNAVRSAGQAWMHKDRPGPKPNSDMADIVDLMLASGCRIGEILALRWTDVDLGADRPTLTVNGTIKTETGRGTYRKPRPSQTPVSAPSCSRCSRSNCSGGVESKAGQPLQRRVRNAKRDLAPGRQHRAPLAADPPGHRLRVGHPAHVP